MMGLIEDLIESVKKNDCEVKDVRVGVSWTGVWSKYCGLSKTYGIPVPHGNYTRDFGELIGKSSLELAKYVYSWNFIEASIGVAAINSMIDPKGKKSNALEFVIEKSKGKRVVMVGRFPKEEEVRKAAKDFKILELDQYKINPALGILPATASEYVIPQSDIAVITGSTLINKSLERLLSLSKESYTIVLGPSTPMSEVLFDYGADVIAGVEVIKPIPIIKKISQTGGMVSKRMCPGEIEYRILEK